MPLPTKVNFSQPANWPAVHHARTGPPPTGNPRDLQSWIHLQHIPSAFDRAVAKAIDQVVTDHRGTTEAWLAVSGERHLGKTNATTAIMLTRSMTGPTPWRTKQASGWRYIPYVFVEASSNPTAKMVMRETCRFLGLPPGGDEADLRARLRDVLPEMGVIAINVDEGQNFRRSSATAKTVADGLRGLLHLPVPMIYSGLDLRQSALLKRFNDVGDSADQLIERAQILDLGTLGDAQGINELGRLIRGFGKRLAEIDGFTAPALTDNSTVKALIAAKSGRPGSILETLKKAAADAVVSDRCLTTDVLFARLPVDARPANMLPDDLLPPDASTRNSSQAAVRAATKRPTSSENPAA